MTRHNMLVFVDSNVLIEALFVQGHPARAVTTLAANGQIDLITCEIVIQDVEDEVLERCRKADDSTIIDAWHSFQRETRIKIEKDPPEHLVLETYKIFMPVMRHEADIPVLASAIQIGPAIILSGNTEHFNDAVSERCGIKIMTCADFCSQLVSGELPLLKTLK
jgi:predicted nucleic acid-binding protein